MSLSDKQFEFLKALNLLILWCAEEGYKITGGELWRTNEMQAIYFADGRSKKRYSKHQARLAQDLNRIVGGKLATSEEYRAMGEFWESLGGIWGGRYGVKKADYGIKVGWDANHFEWRT